LVNTLYNIKLVQHLKQYFQGFTGVWLIATLSLVLYSLWFSYIKMYEVKEQIIELAEAYEHPDIIELYSNLGGAQTEKMNFDAFKVLREEHHRRYPSGSDK